MSKKKKAFTLIEMIVVIAIIGILSTMLLTSVANVRKSSADARRKSNLENVRGAVTMYYSAKAAWPVISGGWDSLIHNGSNTGLSDFGYISDSIKADEDGDGLVDYIVGTCSAPCQIRLYSACEVTTGEGCSPDNKPGSGVTAGDTRTNWYALDVK